MLPINKFITSVVALTFLTVHLMAQPLIRVKKFGNNPGHLKMYMYTPAGLNKNIKTPVVVVLHGCLQSAKAVARQTDWNKLADRYGFSIIYPEQRLINNPERCFY